MMWIFSIIMSVMVLGCGQSLPGTSRNSPASFMDTYRLRFLALGDSYTIGESVDERERWPVQLAGMLREQKIDIADPVIIACTGWTTDELDAAIDRENLQEPFDLVSLLVGVNNQYRERDREEYREQFKRLLQRAIGFAGGDSSHVIVLSIPDWGVMPFAEGRDRKKIAQEIDDFNAINREETERSGAHYVDVTPLSRDAASDMSFIASDGLHPSGKMYEEWARLVLPKAIKMLGERK